MMRSLFATTGLTALMLVSAPAFSQSAGTPQNEAETQTGTHGLGDIVVTAERRATSLQRTPIAVTSFDKVAIADRNIKDLGNLSGQAPGLISPGLSAQRTVNVFYIRGIGEADTSQNPSVGIYIDDVYIPRAWGAVYEIADLSSVEVLRGPQGTLFGRNTSAGLINIKTAEPGKVPHGSLQLSYGNYNEISARASINGPISDTVSGSLSLVHHTRDGYTKGVTLNRDLNKLDTDAVRAKLRWEPSEAFNLELRADAVNDHSDASVYAPVNQPNGVGGAPYDPDKTWVSVYPAQHLRGGGTSLVAVYKPSDELTLKSISAYRRFTDDVLNVNDGGTSYIFNESFTKVKNKALQQEFQALYATDRFHAVAGLFYLNEHYDQNRVVWAGSAVVNTGSTQYIITRNHVRSYAAFAQADYEIFDRVFVTAGMRYSRDRVDYTNVGYRVATVFDTRGPQDLPAVRPATATGAYTVDTNQSWGAFTPKIEAHVQWTPDVMTYASYSRGYKAGGFDTRAATAATAAQPFNPEDVDSFEAGFKGMFLDRHLRTNLAVFYNNFKDLQITAYDATNFIFRRVNAAGAHTKGAELEVTALPLAGLEITGTLAYLDAKYVSFNTVLPANAAGVTTLKGMRLYFAPKWTQSLTVSYKVPLGEGGLRFATNINHRSKTFTDIYDTPQLASPPQYMVNGSITWTDASDHWSIGGSVDNLFNNRKNQGGTYAPTSGPAVLVATGGQRVYANNPPRFFRATFGYKF